MILRNSIVNFIGVVVLFSALGACAGLSEKAAYRDFTSKKDYPKTYAIYEDKALLKSSNGKNSKVIVDTKTQRLRLLVSGKTALDTPTTTGSSKKRDRNTGRTKNKSTPKGKFKITEKRRDKRSTIFGKLYRNNKVVYRGDKRKYKGKYDRYEGASLRNWLRLTDGGIGIHASRGIKRYPASNGCIRVPVKVAPKLFAKVSRGTPVEIR